MLRRVIFLSVTLILLAACQTSNVISDPVTTTPLPMDPNVKQVLMSNMDALNQKNIDAYMATIDPQAPVYNSTRDSMNQLLPQYDLSYEITSMDLVDITATTAKVRVVQTTTKIKGPAFRDNRIRVLDTLNKTSNGWKIYSSDLEDIFYFDQTTPTGAANGNTFVTPSLVLKK